MIRVVFAVCLTISLSLAAGQAGPLFARETAAQNARCLTITSKASRIHLGSIDSFDITEGGVQGAKYLLNALNNKDANSAAEALDVYKRIIPGENFGGEYTALLWFCAYLTASEEDRKGFLEDPYIDSFFHFFADQDFAVLKEYLKRKYHLDKLGDEETRSGAQRAAFLEDFILFNNPNRELWEKTSKIIEVLNVKPGYSIADIGSGPGYYTFKFSEMVGEKGKVYAIDNNRRHNRYVTDLARKRGIDNIEVIMPPLDGIGLDEKPKVDLAFMCSLYHIIYTTFAEPKKDAFVNSIKKSLKPDGSLVIVDNAFLDDSGLPYHGPYIHKDLIISQLEHYGFRLTEAHQFIPQRYILIFKLDANAGTSSAASEVPGSVPGCTQPDSIPLTSKASLLHIQNHSEPDVTPGGIEAAKLFHAALESKDKKTAKEAAELYKRLIPKEKFGDEYSAFQWFAEYLQASDKERKVFLKDRLVNEYFHLLADNDFAVLKKYVKSRYELGTENRQEDEADSYDTGAPLSFALRSELGIKPRDLGDAATSGGAGEKAKEQARGDTGEKQKVPDVAQEDIVFWRDFILFNNPNREQWEKTSGIIKSMNLKQGKVIADIGSGPGYYSFKFSEIVGRKGLVYAVDTNERHTKYISGLVEKYKIPNIKTVLSRLDDVSLPADSIDVAYMCSLYDIIYATSLETVKDKFVQSLRKALRKNGTLIIADNDLVGPDTLPYHGPYIARELIIAQLKYYGFHFVKQYQFIPQRYVLIFQKE